MSVDAELRDVAVRAAARYTDSLITSQGWTRTELVDAIHHRLRAKYMQARGDGALVATPDGRIVPGDRCPTPLKKRYATRRAAVRHQRRHPAPGAPLHPYECPTGRHWHLTRQPQENPCE